MKKYIVIALVCQVLLACTDPLVQNAPPLQDNGTSPSASPDAPGPSASPTATPPAAEQPWQGSEDTGRWNFAIHNGSLDAVQDVAVDSVGNVYVLATSQGLIATNAKAWWVKKYTKDGFELRTGWDKRIEYPGSVESYATSIAVGADDAVYVAGYYQTVNAMKPLLKKYRADGELVYSLDGAGFGLDGQIVDLLVDADSNVYYALNYFNNEWSVYLGSLSANGAKRWQKKLSVAGKTLSVEGACLSFGNNQNVLVGGSGARLVAADSYWDSWYQSYSFAGELQAEKVFSEITASLSLRPGDPGYYADERIKDLVVDPTGNVYTAGYAYGVLLDYDANQGSYSACTTKVATIRCFKPDGSASALNKQHLYRGAKGYDAVFDSLALDKGGNLFASCLDIYDPSYQGRSWVLKKFAQADGGELWSNRLSIGTFGLSFHDRVLSVPPNQLFAVASANNRFSVSSGGDVLIRRFY